MIEKAAASLVAVVALAAAGAQPQHAATPAPQAAATPFVIGTFAPSTGTMADPFASPLPNIGSTRSVTPACAVMRDVVIPSFAAALRADKLFAATQARLPTYIETKDEGEHLPPAYIESSLAKLEQDTANIMRETLVINKALGDPRIGADVKDADVQAERAKLEQLYEMQQARANELSEFVQRERVSLSKSELSDNSAILTGKNSTPAPPTPVANHPLPQLTAPPGMPVFSGMDLADKRIVSDWGSNMTRAVRDSENVAAKTFFPLATRCKK